MRILALDIGKTHARLALVDARSGEALWEASCDSQSRLGALCLELDVARLERWLFESLARVPEIHRVEFIVPNAHGAAAVLLDADNQVVAAPDYEDVRFDTVAGAYRKLRDPYNETFSPFLPLGLNLGRQWHYLQESTSDFQRVRRALLYPQYWAWRLCGTAATEVTSLGCHTDLWRPLARGPSQLALNRGWHSLLPPMRAAGEVLGAPTPEVQRLTGLAATCKVLCGIHDSNASYLCQLASFPSNARFALISSGTWTVVFAAGAELARLSESDDMLANVDLHGAPVATARFMGGREYAVIAGAQAASALPGVEELRAVIDAEAFALPAFAAAGPFSGREGRLLATAKLSNSAGAALGTLYVALMTDLLLERLDVREHIVIDGPLARNALYTSLLQTLRAADKVMAANAGSSAQMAACILAGYPATKRAAAVALFTSESRSIIRYRDRWRQLVSEG